MYMRRLAQEVASDDIAVVLYHPGYIATVSISISRNFYLSIPMLKTRRPRQDMTASGLPSTLSATDAAAKAVELYQSWSPKDNGKFIGFIAGIGEERSVTELPF